MKDTKEQIKNRMIKNAARIWGVEANEIETSFDPIISLLLSACASEIEKISAELDESETRITEKLIELMTPERSMGPSLAHAVICAEPIDKVTTINPEYHFTCRKEIRHDKTSVVHKDISFTPLQDFNLVDARIEHLVTGANHIAFGEKRERQVTRNSSKNSGVTESVAYLGISCDAPQLLFENISFYFELQSTKDADLDLFYTHLANSIWSWEGKPLNVISGFYNSESVEGHIMDTVLGEVSNKSDLVYQEILHDYQEHYITIKSVDDKPHDDYDPNELKQLLEEYGLHTENGLHWMKIVFPTVINNRILKDVLCSLNVFPVINRQLNTFSHRLKDFVHIIPLQTDDLFFDVKSITNTSGRQYNFRTENNDKTGRGSFIVRGNNIGHLEQRRARDYITYLLELLKDESASFSFLNNDFLLKSLKSLNQQIAALEKRVGDSAIDNSQTHFAVLDPYKANDQLLVEFWTSNGSLANGLKSGKDLHLSKGIGVKQNDSYFYSTSSGGKDALKMTDRLNAYRRALLSRDKIVTKEDVRALCFEIYGDTLENVTVQRGFVKDVELYNGWTPCIQILLTPKSKMKSKKELWKHENNKLLYLLEKKSLNVFPYEVKILN